MPIIRAYLALAAVLIVLAPDAQARSRSNPGYYKTTCYAAECYDRYHTPRDRPTRHRSSRSRY